MLFVNVTYTMKPGMRDTFLKEVRDQGVLDAVRHEDGCIQYAYFLPTEEDGTLPSAGGTGRPSRPTWPPPIWRPCGRSRSSASPTPR